MKLEQPLPNATLMERHATRDSILKKCNRCSVSPETVYFPFGFPSSTFNIEREVLWH
jgi:hypothetical protein